MKDDYLYSKNEITISRKTRLAKMTQQELKLELAKIKASIKKTMKKAHRTLLHSQITRIKYWINQHKR